MPEFSRTRRRPVLEFLAIPALIVLGFIVLAQVVDWSDNHAGPRASWGPVRLWLSQYVGDTQAAIGVLSAIAGSLFTVTSLTFSILLLAVQQGATVLNSQVVDHYLRRRSNRVWFGFFVGVSLFVLLTLVQTTHTTAPVLGVMVSTFLGAVALMALVVLIYATVDQTRPMTVISDITETAMTARDRQVELLRATSDVDPVGTGYPILSTSDGYLTRIDLEQLQSLLATEPAAHLSLTIPIGSFVPTGAPLARLSGVLERSALSERIAQALPLQQQRDIANDPAYSLDHIATIGWTAISTAHSDPAVGTIAIQALQKLLHGWAAPAERAEAATQISYHDALYDQLQDSVESLIVAATESHQHQSLAMIINALSAVLPVLAPPQRKGIFRMMNTLTTALTNHLPTRPLCVSLTNLAETYDEMGAATNANALRTRLAHLFTNSEESAPDRVQP